MDLGKTALLKRAKEFELNGLRDIKFSLACISIFEKLLNDIYIAQCPSPIDYQHRRDLIRIFNEIAKALYGSCNEFPIVEAFGSFSMDMFHAKSDLDLSVNFSNDAVEYPREKKIQALKKFAKMLYSFQRKGHVTGVQSILRARVPIVKVIDRGTEIECDISIENKDGIVKSHIIHMVSAIDERFQKLSFLMKAWAKSHGINSSKDGTLNSLSIISLVAFHLQTRDPPILPPFSALFRDGTSPANVVKVVHCFLHYGQRNKESLTELFVTLLNKLASVETLWPEGLCASTYEGAWIFKKWDMKVGSISVEDFTDRSENVARAVGVEEVKKIYRCIYSSLHQLSSFMHGKTGAPLLKEHLFSSDPGLWEGSNSTVNLEGSFPSLDPANPPPINPIPSKRMRYTEGWERKNQVYHETSTKVPLVSAHPIITPQQPPFVAPGIGNVQHTSTWSAGSYGHHLQRHPAPLHHSSWLQQHPIAFEASNGPSPLFSVPHGGWRNSHNSQPHNNQYQGQTYSFNPYRQ